MIASLGMGCVYAVGSNRQTIDLEVDVSPTCNIQLNNSVFNFKAIAGMSVNQGVTMTLDCTPRTHAEVRVMSKNNWLIVNNDSSSKVPYTIQYTGGGYIVGGRTEQIWSGQTVNTIVFVGDAQLQPWQIPLNFSVTFPSGISSGYYSDDIVFQVSY